MHVLNVYIHGLSRYLPAMPTQTTDTGDGMVKCGDEFEVDSNQRMD